MRYLLIILLVIFSSCAATKKKTKTKAETETAQAASESSNITSEKETQEYGDSLSGAGFIPAGDASSYTPFLVESSGIKVGFQLRPQFSADGKFIGSWLKYETVAKPKTTIIEKTKQETETKVQLSTTTKATVADQQTVKNGSRLTWMLWGAGCTFFLLLIFIIIWFVRKLTR